MKYGCCPSDNCITQIFPKLDCNNNGIITANDFHSILTIIQPLLRFTDSENNNNSHNNENNMKNSNNNSYYNSNNNQPMKRQKLNNEMEVDNILLNYFDLISAQTVKDNGEFI